MTHRNERHRHAHKALLATLGFAIAGVIAPSARAVVHPQPPWRIESFCHRGVTPDRRCLIRARQGIIVFQLVELPSAPAVRWSDGVAVLSFGGSEGSRKLRFYVPPQKLSVPFTQVRAYDTRQQLVAFYADGRLHLRAMFASNHDLAALALPANIALDTLRVRIDGRNAQASWRDRKGQTQEQTLRAGN